MKRTYSFAWSGSFTLGDKAAKLRVVLDESVPVGKCERVVAINPDTNLRDLVRECPEFKGFNLTPKEATNAD